MVGFMIQRLLTPPVGIRPWLSFPELIRCSARPTPHPASLVPSFTGTQIPATGSAQGNPGLRRGESLVLSHNQGWAWRLSLNHGAHSLSRFNPSLWARKFPSLL